MRIENKSIEKITKETLKLAQDIKTQENQKEDYYKRVGHISPLLSEYTHLSNLLNEKKAKSQKILTDYGDYNDLILRKKQNVEEIERLEYEIKKEDSLTNIRTSAYSYISETESKNCPICKQEIDPKIVLREVEAQNKTKQQVNG